MKIKMSALVSEIRNKLNGSVASKNRYGNYLRNKVTPVNPQTSYQQNVRQTLASISASWRDLTIAERASWNAGNVNFPFTDIFGDIRTLSGQALFVKLNSNLAKIGQPLIDVAPLPVGFAEIASTDDTGTLAAGAITVLEVELNIATLPANYSLAVYATPPINPGVSFVKPRFRFLGTTTVTTNDADILSIYTSRFGAAATAGQTVFVRMALVSEITGQQGIPIEVPIVLS